MGLLGAIAKRSVDDWVKLGYPESVAKRIVSGELPMDEASRAARRDAFGEKMYHGTPFGEELATEGFDPTLLGEGVDAAGSGYYTTNLIDEASNYALRDANSAPAVFPLRVRSRNPVVATDMGVDVNLAPEQVRELIHRSKDIKSLDNSPIGNWYDIWHTGESEVPDYMIDAVARQVENAPWRDLQNDFYRTEGESFLKNIRDLTGYDSVEVPFNHKKHLVSWDNNDIRSEYAAFDPEYTGPNLLGMRPEALVGLMSIIGSSEQPESLYGTDQATPPTQRQIVNQQMNALGIDPVEQAGYEYGSLIPARKNKQTGEIEPAVPAVGRDIIRGLLDLMEGTQSGYFDPRSAIDVMM